MADKRLRKLRRQEMLEMLLEIEQENESLAEENARLKEQIKEQREKLGRSGALEEENARLKQQLEERALVFSSAGSLAEASVQISGLLEAAQKTADLYLEGVRAKEARLQEENRKRLLKTKNLCMRYAERTEKLCLGRADIRRERTKKDPLLKEQVEALFRDITEAEPDGD